MIVYYILFLFNSAVEGEEIPAIAWHLTMSLILSESESLLFRIMKIISTVVSTQTIFW